MTTAIATPASTNQLASTPEPGLEARLAAADAAMTLRLEHAALAVDVNTADLPGADLDLADVVRGPVALPTQATDPHPTPITALLHRARLRILQDGWCRDAAHNNSGMCLLEAIRAEAHTRHDEGEARLLMHRALGGGDPIPEQNRRLASATHAAQMLDAAAAMAAQHGM